MSPSPFEQFQTQHAEWVALAIFSARVVDVSLGTIRTILVVRGQRSLAAGVGLLEVRAHPSVADLVYGEEQREIEAIEARYGRKVVFVGRGHFHQEQYQVVFRPE